MSVVTGQQQGYTEQDADPRLGENAIHWLVCLETYKPIRSPILGIKGDWFLGYDDPEICVYHQQDEEGFVLSYTIIGFRGTKEMKDIIDDIKLSKPSNGTCGFPRAQEGIKFTQNFLEDNPELSVQVTGHSLGGAIARCVGETLGLGIITFNAAAPASNPVIVTNGNQINYHIVFDIVSAWQSPGTIRLDKGFRPIKSRSIIPLQWANTAMNQLIEAHQLINFSNKKVGVQIDAKTENDMMKNWFYSLPLILRQFIIFYLMGTTKKISFKLPDIK